MHQRLLDVAHFDRDPQPAALAGDPLQQIPAHRPPLGEERRLVRRPDLAAVVRTHRAVEIAGVADDHAHLHRGRADCVEVIGEVVDLLFLAGKRDPFAMLQFRRPAPAATAGGERGGGGRGGGKAAAAEPLGDLVGGSQ